MIIYLLRNGEGFYKIGRTSQPIKKRVAQLQTASPTVLDVIHTVPVEYGSKVEAFLHRFFGEMNSTSERIKGEWFDIPDDDLDLFEEWALKSDNNFKILKDSGNPFI